MKPVVSQRRRARVGPLSIVGYVGLAMVVGVVGMAAIGPFVAPYSPTSFVGIPFDMPSTQHPLGLDQLGRDGFSRMMHGGYVALIIALIGSVLGAVIGITCGIWAAYARGALDFAFRRVTETMLAFPSIMIIILLGAAVGSSTPMLVVAVATTIAPRIGRLARAATLNIRDHAYVDVAVARGESTLYILLREILPNLSGILMVDFAIRAAGATLLLASASFLGLGVQPPFADWGLMIRENSRALTFQPFVSLGPIAAICMLLVGFSLLLDDIERRMWRTGAED